MPAPARLLLALVLVLAAAGCLAAPATANRSQLSIMQDDDELLYRGDARRDAALDRMRFLGVDVIRVTVLWELVGRRTSRSRPTAFGRVAWDPYDRLLRAAQARGLAVYLNPTGPGPPWAHGRTRDRKDRRTYRPNPRAFAQFVAALGRRYTGSYRDENDGRQPLPRVGVWSIWNEPNQGGWLTPQHAYDRTARRVIPTSPAIYRELYLRARRALETTGHDRDTILVGETAPLGNASSTSRSPIRPKRFIRELLCLRPDGRGYTGAAARARRCGLFQTFGPIRASGFAHHPYTKDLPPTQRDRHRDSVTMANVDELPVLLDDLARRSGHLDPGLSIVLSEFGYETKPPDPRTRFGLAEQAEFINVGDWLAFRTPRVVAQTQFLLRDAAPLRRYPRGSRQYWFTYQSGLYFASRRDVPKPAAFAYAMPLVITAGAGGEVDVWGQLRFLPNGFASQVFLQFRPAGESEFRDVGDPVPVTDPLGFYETRRPALGAGTWRAQWRADDGSTFNSRDVNVR